MANENFSANLCANLRIVWALAAKDIADAVKNRTTLTLIITVLFTVFAYRMLPSWQNGDLPPRLALYDAGESRLVAELEHSNDFDLFLATSQREMEAYLGSMDIVVLGLVLPTGFDQHLASDNPVELDGYVIHWASAGAAANVQTFFEAQLAELTGKPARINIDGNTVYTQKDSRGYALLAALSVIFAVTMVGISMVPNIMLEEKQTKTIDALLVSPASAGHVVLGKTLTGLFYCLTAIGVAFAFNLALINHWGLAIVAALCGSLFTVALGLLLGSIIESRGQLTLWAWVMFIPLLAPVLLSVLDDVLPAGLVTAFRLVPTVALSRVLRVSFSDRAPVVQFAPELVLVAGCAVLVLAAVAWVVRRSDR
jgi:ABC-2 type transport system permease protein